MQRLLTMRAVLIGLLASLVIAGLDPYGLYVIQGSYMTLDYSTPAAVFLFFVLVAMVHRIWRRLSPQTALQPPELMIVYTMMITACVVPTLGLTAQILPVLAAVTYYANPANGWDRLIHPHLNPTLVPRDKEAIRLFFEGKPGVRVPWEVWLPPLLAWLPLILALYFVMIATMVIFRRQWMERERLAFPVTQLPLEMVNEQSPLLRKPLFWLGFALPFTVGSLIALHHYAPPIPAPRLNVYVPLFRETVIWSLRLSFPMVGFFYLANLDALFSLWFFNLLFMVVRGYLNIYGVEIHEDLGGAYGTPYIPYKYLGMGAMLMLVTTGLWSARTHLRDVLQKATGRDKAVYDSNEILSYPVAFWGTLLGLLVMSVWIWWSGLSWWGTWLYLLFMMVLFFGLTRVVAETGLAEAVAAMIAPVFTVAGFGSTPFGARGLTALGLTWVYSADIRTTVMASSIHGLCLAERTGVRSRGLFWAMMLAIVVSIMASVWSTLVLAYRYGGANLNGWFFIDGPQFPYKWVAGKITTPSDPSVTGWLLTGFGAAVTGFLSALRQRFVGWPFHPAGFAVGSTGMMDELWLTCFIAWLLKFLILRFGGLRWFRVSLPFFLGLIVGQYTCNGFWLVVDYFSGAKGNQIFWI
ncbi:MAG: DUF6785 family protein [Armatimonadota bacterium]